MEPNFKTRRKIAVVTCIIALVVLVFYTKCSEQRPVLAQTATQLSDFTPQVLKKNDAAKSDTGKKKREQSQCQCRLSLKNRRPPLMSSNTSYF
jgi:hypothetical protein